MSQSLLKWHGYLSEEGGRKNQKGWGGEADKRKRDSARSATNRCDSKVTVYRPGNDEL